MKRAAALLAALLFALPVAAQYNVGTAGLVINAGGGSSSIVPGTTPITGGTAGRILYECGSPVTVCDSANLTFGTAAGQGVFIGAGTAASAVSALSITQTRNFNTSATDYISWAFTTTSTNANDNLLNILTGASGNTSVFAINKAGGIVFGSGGGTPMILNGSNEFLRWTGSAFDLVAAGYPLSISNIPFYNGTALQLSGSTQLTLTAGAVGIGKMTASGTAPGASGAKLELVCGTNAGSAKLIAAAGTSGTAVTIIDNIGSGVTGC